MASRRENAYVVEGVVVHTQNCTDLDADAGVVVAAAAAAAVASRRHDVFWSASLQCQSPPLATTNQRDRLSPPEIWRQFPFGTKRERAPFHWNLLRPPVFLSKSSPSSSSSNQAISRVCVRPPCCDKKGDSVARAGKRGSISEREKERDVHKENRIGESGGPSGVALSLSVWNQVVDGDEVGATPQLLVHWDWMAQRPLGLFSREVRACVCMATAAGSGNGQVKGGGQRKLYRGVERESVCVRTSPNSSLRREEGGAAAKRRGRWRFGFHG